MEPKILFKNLQGFPELPVSNEIETEKFLTASKEIVSIIESFGKLFMPIVYDMNGNIEILKGCYQKSTEDHFYLEKLVINNAKAKNKHITSALLWLKRALELIANFFYTILEDKTESDNLQKHLKLAYESTLKPYHGWLLQNTFSVIYRWVPTRTQLIGTGEIHQENLACLENFLLSMKSYLNIIDRLLKENNLDDNRKV